MLTMVSISACSKKIFVTNGLVEVAISNVYNEVGELWGAVDKEPEKSTTIRIM